jgi:organic hydroperoxide reductase OsmC/OhrA
LRKRFAFVAGNDDEAVGWAKAHRAVPTIHPHRSRDGGHAALCPPYDFCALEAHVPTGKTYKSFQYRNNLVWDTARRGRTSAPGKPDIEIGSPPEFKGEAGVWAPEEMLVAALNACMMLTFVSFAQSKKLEFVAYESAAEGLLANVDGKYRIVEVSVRPTLILSSEADIAAARTIMAEVKANCFISNSITADVKLDPQFRMASDVAT